MSIRSAVADGIEVWSKKAEALERQLTQSYGRFRPRRPRARMASVISDFQDVNPGNVTAGTKSVRKIKKAFRLPHPQTNPGPERQAEGGGRQGS